MTWIDIYSSRTELGVKKERLKFIVRLSSIRVSRPFNRERIVFSKRVFSLGWCSSVDWVRAWEPKGGQLDYESGHMPGLPARSPAGGTREATTHWCFSPSPLPLSLKINKILKKKVLRQSIAIWKRVKLDCFHNYTKINLKWIINLTIRNVLIHTM